MAANLNRNPFVDPVAPVNMVPYECRHLLRPKGLFVRVDMPGVSNGLLRVYEDPHYDRLIFRGATPELWDTSQRIYQFSVLLNKDPHEINIKKEVKNGCVRLFFADAEGSLEFPHNPIQDFSGWKMFYPCDDSMTDDDGPDLSFAQVLESVSVHSEHCDCNCVRIRHYDLEFGSHIGVQFKHDDTCDGCFSCPEDKELLLVSPPTGSYNNPFLVQGEQGVCGSKHVQSDTENHLLLRLDMPGVEHFGCVVMTNHENFDVYGLEDCRLRNNMVIAGIDVEEHEFDEDSRHYLCCVTLECDCCTILCKRNDRYIEDGVFVACIEKKKITP